jgi:hypothetical protein
MYKHIIAALERPRAFENVLVVNIHTTRAACQIVTYECDDVVNGRRAVRVAVVDYDDPCMVIADHYVTLLDN